MLVVIVKLKIHNSFDDIINDFIFAVNKEKDIADMFNRILEK